MKLYVYKIGTTVPSLIIENATDYTDESVFAFDGEYVLAPDVELSSREDCSETLRAAYRRNHIPVQEQLRADVDYLLMMQEG